MKRPWLILPFVVVAMMWFTLSAQTIEFILQPQNIMLTGNVSQYDDNTIVNYKKSFSLSYSAGLVINIPTGKGTEINTGFLFSHQPQNYRDENSIKYYSADSLTYIYNYNSSYSILLNYLKIPIEYAYESDKGKKVSFSCFGGLYFGALFNYTLRRGFSYNGSRNGQQVDFFSLSESASSLAITTNTTHDTATHVLNGEPFNKIDFGISLGVGIKVKISERLSLPLFFTYEIGLVNIKNKYSYYTINYSHPPGSTDYSVWSNDKALQNSLIGLRIGLKLKI
jgi:hypothetical protein